MRGTGTTHRWLDIPLARQPGREVPTWGALAECYERCLGRVAFYVDHRIRDSGLSTCIVSEAIAQNVDLLLSEHDELEELRRLRGTVDRLITARLATAPDTRGS